MLPSENVNQVTIALENARQDSLALWQELIIEEKASRSEEVVLREPDDPNGGPLKLTGRYQVADGREYDCEILEISPLAIRIRGPRDGRLRQWCIANIA